MAKQQKRTTRKKTRKGRRLRRWLRGLSLFALIIFALLNWVAYNHAWSFTHTDASLQGEFPQQQVYKMSKSSFWGKLGYIFWGVKIPKSLNKNSPQMAYETIWLEGTDSLEGWWIPAPDSAKGTVLVFHGYGGCKSRMLPVVNWWHARGYHCLAVDFSGHGGSQGTATTIGFSEAKDVKTAADWARKKAPNLPIQLFGTSMGAVAVLKAAHDHGPELADGLVLECPFGTLRDAVKRRFELAGVPSFLMADLLLFWGGVQHGYWAHGFSSVKYAKKVKQPVLLLYGEQDRKVSRKEIDAIHQQLNSSSQLVTFENVGHNHMLSRAGDAWTQAVEDFLQKY